MDNSNSQKSLFVFLGLLIFLVLFSSTAIARAPVGMVNVVFHGDSTIRGEGLPDIPTENVAARLKQILGAGYTVTNRAVSGASFSTVVSGNINLITSAAVQVDPFYNPLAAHNILIVGSLWNDIEIGDSEAQFKTNIRRYVRQQSLVGWKVVIMSPTLADFPRQRGQFHITRLNILRWLAENYRSLGAIALADFSDDSLIGTEADTSNTVYWLDKLHPAAGYNLIAARYAAQTVKVIDGTAEKPTTPTGFDLTGVSASEIKIASQPPPDIFPVERYEARVRGGAFENHIINIGRKFPFTLSGLSHSTNYTVEIRAVDETGRASDWTTAKTESTYPSPKANWTPLDLPGLRFWGKNVFQDLDRSVPATADGDPVALFEDASANAAHFTKSVAQPFLGLSAIGQARGLRYNGADAKLGNTQLGTFLRNDFTIGFPLKIPSASNSAGVLLQWGDTTVGRRRSVVVTPFEGFLGFSGYEENVMTDSPVGDNRPHWVVVTRRGTLVTVYLDGRKIVSGRPNLTKYSSTGVAVGGNYRDFIEQFQGYTGETIISSVAAEGANLHALNEYFRALVGD